MERKPRAHSALRVVLLYALFGSLWILFSDRVLLVFAANPGKLVLVSTAKGWLFIAVTSVFLYIIVAREMKRQRALEESLSASLAEKETLLGEIHHRVKNNLQIISSILNLERDRIHGEEARLLTDRTRARLRSMSLVHERLYASKELARIDLASYLRALVEALEDIYDVNDAALRFDLGHFEASPETVLAFGLFAAEAVVNSLRHGLQEEREREIRISLRGSGDAAVLFEVRDSGPGFPDLGRPTGLGFTLMTVLSEQLSGRLELSNDNGAVVRLLFPLSGEKNAKHSD